MSLLEMQHKANGIIEGKETLTKPIPASEEAPDHDVDETVGDTTSPTGDENAPVEARAEEKQKEHKYEPPSSWTKEEKEEFYNFDETIQERLIRGEKNREALLTKKSQELSEKMKSIEQMEQVGNYIQSDPVLRTAFENMIKSHYEAKKNGKEWEFGKPDKSTASMKELDALVSMDDAELEAKFVEAPSKFVKSFTEILKASQEQIRAMQGEFQRQLEPFMLKAKQDAEVATLLESLPKENQNFEFVSRLNKVIADGDPSFEGKSLKEVFPLAVEKLTGLVNTEKAKEEGKKEGKAQAELEADKRKMAGPGGSKPSKTTTPRGMVGDKLTDRFTSGTLAEMARKHGG